MRQNIKDTLIEARKAYRFLYDYQKRVLDLANFIGGKFGFGYKGGYSKFSNQSPRSGGGYLTNWSWDWLNLYFYEFNFGSKKELDNEIFFAVFILSDTGFFKATEAGNADKTNTSSFISAEESESKLIFVAGRNLWQGWGDRWDEPAFLLEPFGEKKDSKNGLMIFKHYNLEKFENEEMAMENLRDFEALCLKNQINIRMQLTVS